MPTKPPPRSPRTGRGSPRGREPGHGGRLHVVGSRAVQGVALVPAVTEPVAQPDLPDEGAGLDPGDPRAEREVGALAAEGQVGVRLRGDLGRTHGHAGRRAAPLIAALDHGAGLALVAAEQEPFPLDRNQVVDEDDPFLHHVEPRIERGTDLERDEQLGRGVREQVGAV